MIVIQDSGILAELNELVQPLRWVLLIQMASIDPILQLNYSKQLKQQADHLLEIMQPSLTRLKVDQLMETQGPICKDFKVFKELQEPLVLDLLRILNLIAMKTLKTVLQNFWSKRKRT